MNLQYINCQQSSSLPWRPPVVTRGSFLIWFCSISVFLCHLKVFIKVILLLCYGQIFFFFKNRFLKMAKICLRPLKHLAKIFFWKYVPVYTTISSICLWPVSLPALDIPDWNTFANLVDWKWYLNYFEFLALIVK